MTFPLNTDKTHVLFMHHLEQYFRALPVQTPVPYFHNWLLNSDLTAHRCLKQNKPNETKYSKFLPSIPMHFSSPPTFPI